MGKIVETKKPNDLLSSVILLIIEKFISYIAYLFLVAVVVISLVSFFFLYTSIFQNNPSAVFRVFTASGNIWQIDLAGIMKVVALSGFVFMIFGEMFKFILRRKGRKVNKIPTKKKIIISLMIISAIHIPAIISVPFNNSVKASDKTFFYIFLLVLMVVSAASIIFYFVLDWITKKINNQRTNQAPLLS